jgi:hypothetical protein
MPRRALLTLVVGLLAGSSARGQVLTGRVFGAEDGTPADAASWRAWSAYEESRPCAPEVGAAIVGMLRRDGFFGDVSSWNCCCRSPGAWTVAVEKDVVDPTGPYGRSGYFTLSRATPCVGATNMPASKLVAIPQPVAVAERLAVRLTWTQPEQWGTPLAEDRGLEGWAVYRSPAAADAFTEVGRVEGAATLAFGDETAPVGAAVTYALRPVFRARPRNVFLRIHGLHLGRKSSAVAALPLELRIDARVAALGTPDPSSACGPATTPGLDRVLLASCTSPAPPCSPAPVVAAVRAIEFVPGPAADVVLAGEALAGSEPGVLTLYELSGCTRILRLFVRRGDVLVEAR